jgi:hypothetical protein
MCTYQNWYNYNYWYLLLTMRVIIQNLVVWGLFKFV